MAPERLGQERRPKAMQTTSLKDRDRIVITGVGLTAPLGNSLPELRGNLLVFFDWGDLAIFALPDCAPSIDGRLDACYTRPPVTAHRHLYNAEPADENILNLTNADLALLPSKLAGALALARRPDWKPVYFDDLAAVLVRGNVDRFPQLRSLELPVQGSKAAIVGRATFGG